MTFNKSSPPDTLVVGSNGLIGAALLAELSATGVRAIGTTRRVPATGGSLRLDLNEPAASWEIPADISTAFLCAGITKIDDCRKAPASSSRLNVDAIATLAEKLANQGAFVVFLSTSQVFSGSKNLPTPDAPLSPSTEYGRQKAAAESRILRLGKAAAVVRLTKVSETLPPLLGRWKEALRRGEEIHPFSDMSAAPIPLALVVRALILTGERRLAGITQVSADRDVSYADMARLVAEHLKADTTLVRPMSAKDSNLDIEAVPAHTAMDTARLRDALGLEAPDPESGIRIALESVMNEQDAPMERRP